MPISNMVCSLNVQLGDIHKIFEMTSSKFGFNIIESEERYSTAVYRKCCSIRSLFSFCCKTKDNNMTAIKLETALNEEKCIRKVRIRGIYGVIIYFKQNRIDLLQGSSYPNLQNYSRKKNERGLNKIEERKVVQVQYQSKFIR